MNEAPVMPEKDGGREAIMNMRENGCGVNLKAKFKDEKQSDEKSCPIPVWLIFVLVIVGGGLVVGGAYKLTQSSSEMDYKKEMESIMREYKSNGTDQAQKLEIQKRFFALLDDVSLGSFAIMYIRRHAASLDVPKAQIRELSMKIMKRLIEEGHFVAVGPEIADPKYHLEPQHQTEIQNELDDAFEKKIEIENIIDIEDVVVAAGQVREDARAWKISDKRIELLEQRVASTFVAKIQDMIAKHSHDMPNINVLTWINECGPKCFLTKFKDQKSQVEGDVAKHFIAKIDSWIAENKLADAQSWLKRDSARFYVSPEEKQKLLSKIERLSCEN